MIIRPLTTSIATLLFAPDTEGAPAGGASPAPAIAVSAADSPTGSEIIVTPRTQSSPPIILQEPGTQDPKTAPRVRQKGVETSAAKLLGLAETPQEEAAREAKEFRERDKSGRFTKHPEIGKKKPAGAAPAAPVKMGEPAVPATPPPTPAPAAKIKVGDKELTPEEAAARIAELEKAAKPPDPPAPAAAPEPAKDDATIAAESKAREDRFIEDTFKNYLLDAKDGGEYDQMLAGGPKGAEAFARMMAKVEMKARQYAAARLTEAKNEFDGITAGFQPVLEQHTLAQQYQTEHQFLDANADIKAHASGLQTMREVSHELHAEHDDILALMAANPQSPNAARYQARAKALEENFLPELAKATRAKLNIGTTAPPATATTPPATVAPTPPKARPPAPTGNLGGSRAPAARPNNGGFSDLEAKGHF